MVRDPYPLPCAQGALVIGREPVTERGMDVGNGGHKTGLGECLIVVVYLNKIVRSSAKGQHHAPIVLGGPLSCNRMTFSNSVIGPIQWTQRYCGWRQSVTDRMESVWLP
ncbi:hypothetical protein EVAR_54384_1 [Eumeta japonica]|uniref:Uncharacterized protein n=1 Tax=Eumeta variegata TaxID=151549 RepID=A0A4C1Y814_EUMVA|nr:hypothetical protein EVAR_54384_1 [Eumeta japonica]